MAGVGPGSRVLDAGAGTGDQAIMAARRVGPTGLVLATDVAERMLQHAAKAAHIAGLSHIETRVLDARNLDFESESV
jgi:ubiquinone/menaquinone biosynthesis C-methylase UbiE